MIILVSKAGNHSNRLFQNMHFELFCLEIGQKFYNPTFHDMSELYGMRNKPLDGVIVKILLALKKIRILGLYISYNQYMSLDDMKVRLAKKGIKLVGGWKFKSGDASEKDLDYIREKYSLLESKYCQSKLFNEVIAHKRTALIVGVHVRRGDYRDWCDGKYFFNDQTYLKWMDQISGELNTIHDKKIKFIIFSNEKLDEKKYLNCIISHEEWFVDQKVMSICNYLIGPPSTFTSWASFIGKNMYYHCQSSEDEITLDKFVSYNTIPEE